MEDLECPEQSREGLSYQLLRLGMWQSHAEGDRDSSKCQVPHLGQDPPVCARVQRPWLTHSTLCVYVVSLVLHT